MSDGLGRKSGEECVGEGEEKSVGSLWRRR